VSAMDWPDIAGRLAEDGSHVGVVRVYFEDTDFSGVVYHASYLRWFERGRSDWLRLHGVSHADMAERGAFAVRSMALDFLKPAKIDDVVTIETRVIEALGASVSLAQIARRGAETLVEARVRVVFVTRDGKPARLPADLRARFRAG
jgi:acyl-CoA thioester hydrolase